MVIREVTTAMWHGDFNFAPIHPNVSRKINQDKSCCRWPRRQMNCFYSFRTQQPSSSASCARQFREHRLASSSVDVACCARQHVRITPQQHILAANCRTALGRHTHTARQRRLPNSTISESYHDDASSVDRSTGC